MIITTNKNFFLARCSERHYSLEEVSECIISKNDDQWTIDTDHPKYPKIPKDISQSIIDNSEGAGKELKILLSYIGLKSSENCSCNAKAQIMNRMGIKWCKDNIDTIMTWLKSEAEKRHLPFSDIIAKKIIQLAIYRAEKKEKYNAISS